ncbi:hypothetical protein Asppvi_011126 [Aspergillus pseudoviridinutans]|uniref:FAD-binding PCMH-type domain-containing protein n=1 Tax=Aspergillus pseudoviridinutans TaxID=1517512 RepID=A0A9P3BIZ6_9EURO|nr:uncharacterized protein Asppvi_011126 [Aspergillus pseudoviridinutans]GIJ92150.1 hypothetical protein Asppvi_011126 [Aspergillus pseudoviridinutans]
MSSHTRSAAPDTKTLEEFFNDAASVLGEENVSRTPEHGALNGLQNSDSYGDSFSTVTTHQPSGAVRPKSVEEVQEIVKLANRHKVPLWTVSRGKNLGYGGSSAVVKGSVILDLHRMNKIIELSEEYGYAIVEPGVSFFDLYEEIQRRGLNLWPSVPAIGWGSVLGNTVDRGFGYTPNGEHSQSQCGMEVVLPNGDLLRTGMGAVKDNKTFPLYKGGFGPGLDGLFYQSNLGIVTKIGIHITPAPEAYATVEVSVPREEDIVPLVGTLSDLMRRSIILNSPSIANIFRIALTSQVPEVHAKLAQYMKPGSYVPYPVLEEIRRDQNWGFWRAYFSLYGSVEMLPALLATIKRAFSGIQGVQIKWREFPGKPGEAITAAEINEEEIPHSGIPTLAPLGIVNSRSETGGGHIDYSPVIPASGRELYEWYLTAKQRTMDAKFDFFADFHVYPRYVIGIELIIYTLQEEARVHQLCRHLVQDGAQQGYIPYRTHVSYMDNVARKLDFNHSSFSRFVGLMKHTLDPKGILSPGKSGIWYRDVSEVMSSLHL